MTNQKLILSKETKNISFLSYLIKQLRLVWLLFQDQRVPFWVKSVLPILFLYVISPLDILPDVLVGLGQLDDLGVILLGITLFVKLCPQDLVEYYRKQIENESSDKIIDAAYQEVDKDK